MLLHLLKGATFSTSTDNRTFGQLVTALCPFNPLAFAFIHSFIHSFIQERERERGGGGVKRKRKGKREVRVKTEEKWGVGGEKER